MKGYDLIVDTGCTDHVVRDRAVFSSFESWNEGTTMKKPSCTLPGANDQWKWRPGTAVML